MAFSPVDDDYGDFGVVVSKELAAAIKISTDMIDDMIPTGEIVPIMVNIPGVPTPNSDIWQECNGSEITNPNSPLRSQPGFPRYTPDMTDRYIRIVSNLGLAGSVGGVNSYANFGHSHGIASWTSPEGADSTKSGLENTSFDHTHGMASALPGSYNFEPEFFVVKFFMRIQ